MDMNTMGGIFGANRFRPPQPANGNTMANLAPSPPNDSTNGRIMPPGNAMGAPPQDAQNSFMPQGAPMGPGMGGSGMPPINMAAQDPQQGQQPLTSPAYSARAPIMDPNNNIKLDALKAGVLNSQDPTVQPGTPTQNTPATNMQNVPFMLNQLRAGANAPGMM